jgi:hypothetical protein
MLGTNKPRGTETRTNMMKTKRKTAKVKKPHVKVQDIEPKKEVRGGFNPQPDPPGRRSQGY